MRKAILTSLIPLFILISSGAIAGKAEEPKRILLQWTSHQQMNWKVNIKADGFRFTAVPLAAADVDTDGGRLKADIAPDKSSLSITCVTTWSTEGAVVEIDGNTGTMDIEVDDPYVKDRHTTAQLSLSDLREGRAITVTSKQWPIRNCTLRFTMNRAEIERESKLLRALGSDRKRNIDTLLLFADKAQDRERRTDLLFRAAAACSGGCNHGPLQPKGWDRAIAIYQKIIDENNGADSALNAMWAQASCYACWSSQRVGDDEENLGKGDWKTACKLYKKLYEISASPSDKADALRRMAEVQILVGDWDAGLRNYRKIVEENPGALPPPTHWTYRTCAPHCGTDQLAWDIYRAMVYSASDSHEVQLIYNDYFGNVKGNCHMDELALLALGKGACK